MKIKLKKRLKEIFDFIDDSYDECWDTCCDHGHLGLSLLESRKVNKVHFVDQVDTIIFSLEEKVKSFSNIDPNSYELYVLDAKKIRLSSYRSVICICGVGGDVAKDIIESLKSNNDLNNHDFLFSVNYHIYELREYLSSNEFLSVKEKFFYDGRWPYELLLVSLNRGEQMDNVGSKLFEKETIENKEYIYKLIEHYKKKGIGDQQSIEIAGQYEKIVTKWNL